MYKLLIVIAIQFCLPFLAYGVQSCIPIDWLWSLDSITVIINTICAGSMIGLLRPRWKGMLLGTGLLICYLALWQEVHFSQWRDFWINPTFHDRWLYLKYLLLLALVSTVVGGCLSYFLKLDLRSQDTESKSIRFSVVDLLLYTALVAVLIMTASLNFKSTEIFDNFLGFFVHADAVWLISALMIFYQLLWHNLSWKRVFLAVSIVAIFLMAMLPMPDRADMFGFETRDYHIMRFGFLYLAIATVVLYRAAGLRIFWRKSEPLQILAVPAERG